jgi:hypothetical protein
MTARAESSGWSRSKRTRFEKHGATGHTPATVADSWIEKPGGFSISMALRTPPGRGVWAAAAPTTASTTRASAIDSNERRLMSLVLARSGVCLFGLTVCEVTEPLSSASVA